jgi:nucleoside-diphosphate-sugar epimerase
MKLLITGGSGFLGKKLIEKFCKKNEIVAIKFQNNIDIFHNIKIYSVEQLEECFYENKDISCVVHAATSYGRETKFNAYEANENFAMQILKYSIKNNINKFINIDTFFTLQYKNNSYQFLQEYILSKKNFRDWGNLLCKGEKTRFINAILFHMYGPNDNSEKFVQSFIHKCFTQSRIEMTSGVQKRDFIYLDDVVSAIEIILNHNFQYDDSIIDIEIGTGIGTSILEFSQLCNKLCGNKSELLFGVLPQRSGEFTESIADTRLIKSMGWNYKYDLKSGLLKIISK